MGGLVEAASGVVDRRLLTTTFLPLLAFLSALAAVAVGGVGWATAARWWSGLGAEVQVVLSGLVLAGALLISQLVAVRRAGLIRLYEGYWDGLPYGEWLAERCRLRFMASDDQRGPLYPVDESRLMPTVLGNILRGAEDHSRDRYGIEGVTAWPRLYATLPDTFRQTFAAAAGDLDLMVTVSGLGLAFSLVGGVLGALLLPWYWALGCCWGGLVVAWWGYRGAVRAAEPYGELFRSAFDVYRWTLLDTMGLRRPAEYRGEPEQWRQLDKLWAVGAADSEHATSLGYPVTGHASESTQPLLDPSGPVLRATEPAPKPTEPVPDPAAPRDRPLDDLAPTAGASLSASEGGRKARPPRLGPWLVAVAAVAGILVVAGNLAVRSPGGWVAARTLHPYQVLAATDVKGPSAAGAAGRYVLRQIEESKQVPPEALGPRLPSGAVDGKTVITLRPGPGHLYADAAARGTTATLRLVLPPATLEEKAESLTFPGVTVLDLSGGEPRTSLVIALPGDRVEELLGHVAGSDVYLVTTTS
ncbi:hypothetical protein [Nonomuraea guangzhouensis]|uniref:Uncharacterized protein n=1 Tax=Nonomuraea guangzhouensis TaxID=1291555 RepID=A0ABW4FZ77_9ACTN|nr:hypothetical protein [Nonomuraea guangzhouensis]